MRAVLFCIIFILQFYRVSAQPYLNPDLPIETRVGDLLARMTPEEKFRQMFMLTGEPKSDTTLFRSGLFGFQIEAGGESSGPASQKINIQREGSILPYVLKTNQLQFEFREKSRLKIPIIPFDEALHGLTRKGATSFPQAIGLAATWDTSLVSRVAGAIAVECRTRGIRQALSPVVNIATDARWGRVEETYGEDPFLVSEMSVAFISAFEKRGVIATPKHFVANVGAGGRDSYPIYLNEGELSETHLPPFEAGIRRGGARSIMTAYNSYNGRPCTSNAWLLRQLLKNDWGFRGFVISDAGSTGGANVLHGTASDYDDAGAQAINAGLDVIYQTDFGHRTLFEPAFYDGRIDSAAIDEAVTRILRAKFELGLFENPYVDESKAKYWNGHPDHRALAFDAAIESAVLLKNEGNILPFSSKIRTIAVIGPDADEVRLGGYSGPGNDPISILAGIRKRAGDQILVRYAEGCKRREIEYVTVPETALSHTFEGEKKSGLKGEYFNNIEWAGEPVLVRKDAQIDFQWTLYSPDPERINYGYYSTRWTGSITAPQSGRYKIGIEGNDGYRLYINDRLLIDQTIKRTHQTRWIDFVFEKGRAYDLKIEYYEPVGNARFRLIWNVGLFNMTEQTLRQAVRTAAKSDVAVLVAGIEEGEFQDRADLRLPGRQEELIERVAATGTPVVVLLVGGGAITMRRWINQAKGIMAVWYPGEMGGVAIASLLFGDENPAGRLPITYPVSEGQLPLTYRHQPTGRGDDYLHFTGKPQFPFGFGLSYTRFGYYDMRFDADTVSVGDTAYVSVRVTNTGHRAGDEVVQMYLRDELASIVRPLMTLQGFQRIRLQPGESREVRFTIYPEMLALTRANGETAVEPGAFRVMIGASSFDIRARSVLNVR